MSKTFEEIWCHKEVMGSENANALWRAGQKIAQEADAALAAKDAEVKELRIELARQKAEHDEYAAIMQKINADRDEGRKSLLALLDAGKVIQKHQDAELAKLREELAEARKVIDLFAQVPPSERRTLAAICDSPHPDDAIYGYRYFGMMRAARAFLARKEAK